LQLEDPQIQEDSVNEVIEPNITQEDTQVKSPPLLSSQIEYVPEDNTVPPLPSFSPSKDSDDSLSEPTLSSTSNCSTPSPHTLNVIPNIQKQKSESVLLRPTKLAPHIDSEPQQTFKSLRKIPPTLQPRLSASSPHVISKEEELSVKEKLRLFESKVVESNPVVPVRTGTTMRKSTLGGQHL
ncbi:Hypothetical protein EIN_498140, partial [Entamoeba invadens IP1]